VAGAVAVGAAVAAATSSDDGGHTGHGH
jgi:hypothetical protein